MEHPLQQHGCSKKIGLIGSPQTITDSKSLCENFIFIESRLSGSCDRTSNR